MSALLPATVEMTGTSAVDILALFIINQHCYIHEIKYTGR
jgi:hypothetical protein